MYQDTGLGLDPDHFFGWGPSYIGNYGDNTLLYFKQYNAATPGSPLYEKARTGTTIGTGDDETDAAAADGLFENLREDVENDRLPQVSWIIAPESYTEHPQWPAGYGAWYTANVLNSLTSNPEVWSKTALIITYDENDGFFDHVVSPVPNVGSIPGKSNVAARQRVLRRHARPGRRRRSGPVRSRCAGADNRRVAVEHRRLREFRSCSTTPR